MVQIVCSDKVYEKLRQELAKYQIEIQPDSHVAVVEQGYEVPVGKLSIIFDAIDYMDVVRLLVSGVRADSRLTNTLTGFSDNKFAVMETRDLLYLEAGPDGLAAYTQSKRYSIRETLQYYEQVYAAGGFIRINKSQLVNLMHVQEIVPWFNSRYVLRMDNGAELEVSKMYAKKLRTTLHL